MKGIARSTSIFLIVCSLFFLACINKRSDKNEQQVKQNQSNCVRWYYPDGKLRKVQCYDKNGIENGVYKYYYPSGILKDSAVIVDGVFHGSRYQYHESGGIYILSHYWNDSCRNAVDYREDGTLEYYRSYSYDGRTQLFGSYSEKGELIEFIGNLIYDLNPKDEIVRGTSSEIEVLVAKPPKSGVYVDLYNNSNGALKLIKKGMMPDYANRIVNIVDLSSNKEEIFTYKVSLFDSTSSNVFVDSMEIRIHADGSIFYKID